MRFSDIKDLHLPLGRLSVWVASEATLAQAAERTADPRGPSHNQRGHIREALARRVDPDLFDLGADHTGKPGKAAPTGWLGVAFEVSSVDGHGLRRAFESWIGRHETLRSGFRPTAPGTVDAEFERFTLAPEEVRLEEVVLGDFTDVVALAETLDDLFNRSTDAVSWPAYAFAAIASPQGTTVVTAFDHVNVDGYSILASVGEIQELVDADLCGRAHGLPTVPSYLDFVQDELALASEAGASHEAIETWRSYLEEGDTLPSFPLPDGLPAGSQVPQEARCMPILTADQTNAFAAWCRANGASAATGFLAAMALAFGRIGNDEDHRRPSTNESDAPMVDFRSLVSTHTRHEAQWAEALGWFTAIAPFATRFPAGHELVEILPLVGDAWATAKRGAGLPMSRVSDLLDAPLQPRFVVSYLDARFTRGADRWKEWNAHALIGDVGPTDEVYVWINRMPTETYLTWRFPGNETCRAEVVGVTEAIREIIVDALPSSTEPVRRGEKVSTPW